MRPAFNYGSLAKVKRGMFTGRTVTVMEIAKFDERNELVYWVRFPKDSEVMAMQFKESDLEAV